jgi:hypothetical protein
VIWVYAVKKDEPDLEPPRVAARYTEQRWDLELLAGDSMPVTAEAAVADVEPVAAPEFVSRSPALCVIVRSSCEPRAVAAAAALASIARSRRILKSRPAPRPQSSARARTS